MLSIENCIFLENERSNNAYYSHEKDRIMHISVLVKKKDTKKYEFIALNR